VSYTAVALQSTAPAEVYGSAGIYAGTAASTSSERRDRGAHARPIRESWAQSALVCVTWPATYQKGSIRLNGEGRGHRSSAMSSSILLQNELSSDGRVIEGKTSSDPPWGSRCGFAGRPGDVPPGATTPTARVHLRTPAAHYRYIAIWRDKARRAPCRRCAGGRVAA